MTHEKRLAIVGGTAFLGRELAPVPDSVVIIEGRAIVAAGGAQEIAVPHDATVLDAHGGAVIPGFIDAHVHIGFADPGDVLRAGVTTVRDLAWPTERIYPLAKRSTEPGFDGPLILAAGPMLTVEGGYPLTAGWAPPGTGRAIHSVDDATRAVAQLWSEGVSVIKVALNPPAGKVLGQELLHAICNEAHEHELRVTGHIHGLTELHKALDAGVDELAHMLMSPERIPQETIDRLVEAEVRIVPTLSIFPDGEAELAIDNLSHFIARGGSVVYGTDLGNEGPQPGIDASEVARMEAAGMSVADIVWSATVDAARWLGLERKGHITPGMDADLVCLERMPEQAIDLTRVAKVVREGRVAV